MNVSDKYDKQKRSQLIKESIKRQKRFTPQQKLQILKEWELSGNGVEVVKRYQIHPHILYRWRKVVKKGGIEQ